MYLSLSIITTCKGRLNHLQRTLPRMVEQECPVIVVDYDCPEHTADWVSKNYPHVRIVRHQSTGNFNHSHARNLGAREAASEYLFFVDADVLLTENLMELLRSQFKHETIFCNSYSDRNLVGTFICPRLLFEKCEGYDEQFQGWGGEDCDLYERLLLSGGKIQQFPPGSMESIPHDNRMRTAFVQEQNLAKSQLINRLYSLAKLDLIKLTGKSVNPSTRKQLYKQVSELIAQTEKRSLPGELHFPVRQEILSGKTATFEIVIRLTENNSNKNVNL